MAHKRDYKPEDILFPNQVITESELVGEMQRSYIDYAMSVIVGRALPDVRDGLKPVHRRILYTMYESGLSSDKPFKKSATCVGDVLGHYHPHGDASVYDAMVRLAQDFSMRYMLVDGHGNFGSVDGDPPAAYRYTEARLSKISNEMLRDIEKDTVDWDPNFDESRKEPRVLPSRFPNLLVNGSSGIAVGMATNIPPHNLTEVINACVCVLENPNANLMDLMQHLTGPDFPTRGIIMGRSGIMQAYATGRGKIVLRARAEFEEHGQNRTRIIVTELPYQVNKRQLIRNIADQVHDKRLEGISDLRDETDRNGMRIVIELKRDANPQVVLNRLYKQTALQSSFSINMLALVNNQTQPKILNLRSILDEYLVFQEDLIVRRTRFDLKKAEERAHLLEGLLLAQDNIDEVIRIIRNSYDNAKQNLMARFGFSDVQAQAICDMRLIQLQGLNREKLEEEYRQLEEKIAYYKELLADPEKIKGVLKDELIAIRDKFGDERKTEIQDVDDEIVLEDLIEEEECVFTLTHGGYIKRLPVSEYRAQGRGGKGVRAMSTKEEDYVRTVFTASTHDNILFFTSKGRVFVRKGYTIPAAGRAARGTNIVNILPIELGEQNEKVSAMIRGRGYEADKYLFFVTRNGTVKRISQAALKNLRNSGIRAISLDEGDELIAVLPTEGEEKIIISTHNGQSILIPETDVRVMGRTAVGVRGIRLRGGDYVVGAGSSAEGDCLLSITEKGFGKRTALEEYRYQSRGGTGVISHRITEKTGPVAAVKVVRPEEDILLVTDDGTMIRVRVDRISEIGRNSQGVHVMRLAEGSRVIDIEKTERVTDPENQTAEDSDLILSAEVPEEAQEAGETPETEEP
ncbi:MAG: DNA gyrase subunit A [Oscillospiraceae bacterium]|nr:DNA gyrase subunit A [Oscillospiraceae bacterium]MBO7373476.1 DNA gyrase subunit A [Oscillospiraceae bacterium]MBP5239074.1 DNA gyrase subunit A [Oscillospiraceae bacterium]